MKRITFIALFTITSLFIVAQNGSITGKVIDKLSQRPITNVTVAIPLLKLSNLTDTNGVFRFTKFPTGTYNLLVTNIGYKSYNAYNVIVTAGNELNLTIELELQAIKLTDATIKGSRRTARAATLETPLSVQRLTSEEIKANPGGNFDISKVIQTLPGVGGGQGGGGFRNDIIIRGGAPNENVFYLDGVEIPVINHFQTQGSSGGPQGMLNVSFIEDVKLSSSAFDARYDNAMSSVFQFKQKNGNPNKLQGNFRLSATEIAQTLEGPIGKKTTFLASARRSYLQLLFSLIDLPIRPNYWDFQTKITHQIDKKTTLSFIGIGAIDEFSFAKIKDVTPEKLFVLNSNPIINQNNYTVGLTLKRLVKNGFYNIALSRNSFVNKIDQWEDNEAPQTTPKILTLRSNETENKLRFDMNKTVNGWRITYGASAQLVDFNNDTYSVIRKQITDNLGNIIQPAVIANFSSPLKHFGKFGAFTQLSKRFADNRLGFSAGVRSDMNSFTVVGMHPLQTLSPRVSISYTLADEWTANASTGIYYKLAPYTILGYANNSGQLVNQNAKYLQSNHLAGGFEYLPNEKLRVTFEGFYKKYSNVPISVRDGISLSNLGSDFTVLGNEQVNTTGKGKAYGFELFAQQKLSTRFFGILSYTYYRSLYAGSNGKLLPSSWDNKHLLSATWGYKFKRNWELGLKFRYQGGAAYTPYDNIASQLNFLSRGRGILDYAQLNSLRLKPFHSSDVRIDKKWNWKRTTIDLFLDVTNWYAAKTFLPPDYTFKRTTDNSAFATSNGLPIQSNGANAIPILLKNEQALATPTIGIILEF